MISIVVRIVPAPAPSSGYGAPVPAPAPAPAPAPEPVVIPDPAPLPEPDNAIIEVKSAPAASLYTVPNTAASERVAVVAAGPPVAITRSVYNASYNAPYNAPYSAPYNAPYNAPLQCSFTMLLLGRFTMLPEVSLV